MEKIPQMSSHNIRPLQQMSGPFIVPVIGATGAGKTTLLETAEKVANNNHNGLFGCIYVGKMLRAKYPPEFFKGQASPEHTQVEAWNLFISEMDRLLAEGKKIILVDGQPRCLEQVDGMCQLERRYFNRGIPLSMIFVHLYAPLEVRRKRTWDRTTTSHPGSTKQREAYELAYDRSTRDMQMMYEVMSQLYFLGQSITHFNTYHPDYAPIGVCKWLDDLLIKGNGSG